MAQEVSVAREGGVRALNAVRESLPRPLSLSPTKRSGKRSSRLLPELKASDIIDTSETFEGGGSLTVLAERTNEGLASKENMEVYRKEKAMSRALAKDGHNVVLRQDSKKGETYDITIDGRPADLKWCTSTKYMLSHAEKATTKQGAEMTVFMLDGKWRKFRGKIHDLSEKGYHGYYIKKSGEVGTY